MKNLGVYPIMRKSTKNRRNLAIQNSLIPLSDDGEWWTTLQIEKILAGIDKLMADQKVNSIQTQKFDWASRVSLGHIDVEPWMQISLSEYPAVTRALIDRVSQIHGKQGATLTGMWIMQTMQQPRRKTEFAATCTFEKCLYVIESMLNLSENKKEHAEWLKSIGNEFFYSRTAEDWIEHIRFLGQTWRAIPEIYDLLNLEDPSSSSRKQLNILSVMVTLIDPELTKFSSSPSRSARRKMFEGKQDVADYIEGLLCTAEIQADQTQHLFTILGWLYSKKAKPIQISNTTKQTLIDLHSKNQEKESDRYQQTAIALMKNDILHAISDHPKDRLKERAPRF